MIDQEDEYRWIKKTIGKKSAMVLLWNVVVAVSNWLS